MSQGPDATHSASMQCDFSGRTVLVTGGTSGIGLAIAQGFRSAGATVVVAGLPGHNTSALQGLQVAALDVTDSMAVESVVGQLDRLDVLVNAAGMIRRGEEHDLAVFQQVLDVNLTANWLVIPGHQFGPLSIPAYTYIGAAVSMGPPG